MWAEQVGAVEISSSGCFGVSDLPVDLQKRSDPGCKESVGRCLSPVDLVGTCSEVGRTDGRSSCHS